MGKSLARTDAFMRSIYFFVRVPKLVSIFKSSRIEMLQKGTDGEGGFSPLSLQGCRGGTITPERGKVTSGYKRKINVK